jgi:hypothetical protein
MPTVQAMHVKDATAMRHLTRRLVERYAGRYTPDEVEQVIGEVHERLAQQRIQAFVPLLVERAARETLDARTPNA